MFSTLITGGAGFIGAHLCGRLLDEGHTVVAFDNFEPYYDPQIKEAHVAPLLTHPRFHLIRADIRDARAVENALRTHHIDQVVHLAAKAGVRPSILDPVAYADVNVNGTTVLINAMHQLGVKRLAFASSSSVYGNQTKMPFSETDDVSRPISPYAATKRAGELLCHAYHHLHGMHIACLRLFTVYGPHQRPDLAIHKFTELALQGQPIPLFGDGSTRRDYTYVDDITAGFSALLQRDGWGYEIVNLGGGNPVSLLDMVKALENALGRSVPVQFLEKQPGDVDQTHADIAKAHTLFGYAPQVDLKEGVKRFVNWYLSQHPRHAG